MRHHGFSAATIALSFATMLAACATDERADRNAGHAGTSAEGADGSVGPGADGGLTASQRANACDSDQPDIEGCPCEGGDTHACYDGPEGTRGLGACTDGVQKCVPSPIGEFYQYGPCKGAKLPASEEACDGEDRDCNGAVDDGCPCTDEKPRECDNDCVPPAMQTCGEDGKWSDCTCGIPVTTTISTCAPRLVSPMSTARVTSQKPTLEWALPKGATGAHIDLCADRDCKTILESLDATGTTVVPTTTLKRGVVYWRAGLPGDESCPPSPVWEFFVNARTAPVDTSWGTVFDVNGDGYADILVGAANPTMELGMPATPKTFLYLGGPSGLATTAAFTMDGDFPASAGDVNGDGFPEAIVQADSETYHLFYGSAAGLIAKFVVVKEASGIITTPSQPVASAGDVDRDGYGDVIFGGNFADRARVYHGGPKGLGASPVEELTADSGNCFNPSMSHVANAGDVNGDGYGDVLVTCGDYGRVLFFYGSATGIDPTRQDLLKSANEQPGFPYGAPTVGGGDVNGDGYADAIVTDAPRIVDFQWGVPSVWVHHGSATGISLTAAVQLVQPGKVPMEHSLVKGSHHVTAVDANGDGFWDVAIGNPLLDKAWVFMGSASGASTTAAVSLDNGTTYGRFGDALGAGDYDGNGFEDLVISAPWALEVGRVYGFSGSAGGVVKPAAWTLGETDTHGFGACVTLGASGS